jgi:hypothetical protein
MVNDKIKVGAQHIAPLLSDFEAQNLFVVILEIKLIYFFICFPFSSRLYLPKLCDKYFYSSPLILPDFAGINDGEVIKIKPFKNQTSLRESVTPELFLQITMKIQPVLKTSSSVTGVT